MKQGNRHWFVWALAAVTAVLLLTSCGPAAGTETAATENQEAHNENDTDDAHADEEEHDEEAEHADDEHDEEEEHADDEHDHDEEGDAHAEDDHAHDATAEKLPLPQLMAASLDGEPLRVVATTSIIGDVVAQVGGDAIDLTVLMGPGQDPHSYEPAARDLTAVAGAHVIFINGWNLEEGLADDLAAIGEDVPVIAISANIEPLEFGADDHTHEHEEEDHEDEDHEDEDHEDEDHDDEEHDHEEEEGEAHDHEHSGADPHVWFSIHNVETWVENAAHVLSDLDPANAETYEANAAAYLAELEALETAVAVQLAALPADNRFLVTNHESLAYFAHEYDFTVLGAVIPGASTLAEPSASELADLITEMGEHGVCTLFAETTVSDTLAQTVASELNECDNVQVVKLYTGALGPAGSGAESYIDMFRSNVDAIVAGLGE